MKNLNMRRTAHEDLTPTQIISRLAALGAILTVGSLFIADYYNLFDKKKSQTSISKSFSDREKDPFSAIESQLNANKQRLTEEINSNFSDIVRVSSGPEDTLAGCLVNLKELLRKIMRNDPIDNDIMLGGAVISGGFESGNFNTTYLPDNTSFSSDFDTLNTSPLATKNALGRFDSSEEDLSINDVFKISPDVTPDILHSNLNIERTPEEEEELLIHILEVGGLELEKFKNSFTVGEITLQLGKVITEDHLTESQIEQASHRVIDNMLDHYSQATPVVTDSKDSLSAERQLTELEVVDPKHADGRIKGLPDSCQALFDDLVKKYSFLPKHEEFIRQRHIAKLKEVTPLAIANFKQQYNASDLADIINTGINDLFDEHKNQEENQSLFDEYFQNLSHAVKLDAELLDAERARRLNIVVKAAKVGRDRLNVYYSGLRSGERAKNIVSTPSVPPNVANESPEITLNPSLVKDAKVDSVTTLTPPALANVDVKSLMEEVSPDVIEPIDPALLTTQTLPEALPDLAQKNLKIPAPDNVIEVKESARARKIRLRQEARARIAAKKPVDMAPVTTELKAISEVMPTPSVKLPIDVLPLKESVALENSTKNVQEEQVEEIKETKKEKRARLRKEARERATKEKNSNSNSNN